MGRVGDSEGQGGDGKTEGRREGREGTHCFGWEGGIGRREN